jgi:hypothetical protein
MSIPKESAWGYREDVTHRVRGASGIVQLRLPAFDLDLMGQLVGGRAPVDYTIASRVLVEWETPQPGEVYFPVTSFMEMHAGSGPAATHFRRRVAPYGDVTHVAAARSRAWLELFTIVVPGLTVPVRSVVVEVDVSPGRPSPFIWSETIDGDSEPGWFFWQYPGNSAHPIPPFVREINIMPSVLDAGPNYSDVYQIPGHVVFGRTPDGAYVVRAQPFGPAAGGSSNFTMFDLDQPLAGQERHWVPIPTDARTVQVRLPIPTEIGMPESVLVFWRGYR